ncbi:MAG: hypothetical protein U5K31_05685 [Balneolaceae bacterium]|nr:hypothetical protein [Balneolaceae bacterium]
MTRHGTTGEKPWECFQATEQGVLGVLPQQAFELADWKAVRVHPYQYVQFEKTYYSLPQRYVGHRLCLRADARQIELYDEGFSLIKCFPRQSGRRRVSDPADFPVHIQTMMNSYSVRQIREQARGVGPDTTRYLETLLTPHAMQNLRKAMGILSLAEKHSPQLVETAARQALAASIFHYKGFRALLEAPQTERPIPLSSETRPFIRSGDYFTHTPNSSDPLLHENTPSDQAT